MINSYSLYRRKSVFLITVFSFLSFSALQAQIISTIAGIGTSPGFFGDGGPAVSALLNRPQGVSLDAAGNIYVADNNNQAIRKINTSGTISTIAGTVAAGYSGDGGPATLANLNRPFQAKVDALGNVYIADTYNHCIRKVSTTGMISTIAGNGTAGYLGDGTPASTALLNNPCGLVFDAAGNLYIGDSYNHRIRKIDMATGIISTYAGTGTLGYSGDGFAATTATLSYPNYVYIDQSGAFYITDNGNHVIRKIDGTGTITTVAGNGIFGFFGDGFAATTARLNYPGGVTTDLAGNLFIADNANNRIRKVDPSGIITTFAGTGAPAFGGDGSPAISAQINQPKDLAMDALGNMLVVDNNNSCIRKITYINTPPSFAAHRKICRYAKM